MYTIRCDGKYTLVLHQAGLKNPSWMRFEAKPWHRRFGYLSGLSGDQIAYATQASEAAVIVHHGKRIKADILRDNIHSTEERLFIAFDAGDQQDLAEHLSVTKAKDVDVRFELKHSYFRNLHKSIKQLPVEAIEKIMPQRSDFQDVPLIEIPTAYKDILKLDTCSPDQVKALEAIISCPSNGPPVLVSGPFGTGKTHILAIAAHYFIQKGRDSGQPVRVLVCTQQQVSADAFLKCYVNLIVPKMADLVITRLTTEFGFRDRELRKWCKTATQFKRDFERSSHSNDNSFLIITTCQTALHVATVLQQKFFTHILLDEAAQTREPEGVAPLCIASRDTKIVIAGDQNQVSTVFELSTYYRVVGLFCGQIFSRISRFCGYARKYYLQKSFPGIYVTLKMRNLQKYFHKTPKTNDS